MPGDALRGAGQGAGRERRRVNIDPLDEARLELEQLRRYTFAVAAVGPLLVLALWALHATTLRYAAAAWGCALLFYGAGCLLAWRRVRALTATRA